MANVNNGFDKSFDAEKAAAWKMEVDAEFDSVDRLLQQVHQSLTSVPGEGDTWMEAMDKIGKVENDAWQQMKSDFKQVSKLLGEIFDSNKKFISEGVQKLQDDMGKLAGYKR